ncbi:hypothetical protein [Geovibrio ferrireducens]|uniref:hypothetical protein n=1 Tax=Geovibrio ferrireducens TaxID=46201 RepID=UPI002245A019|nr:hypothetical protein [Geovibrio ferrireducens]
MGGKNMELSDSLEVILCQLAALRHFTVLCGDGGNEQVKTGLGYLFDHVERDIEKLNIYTEIKENCHP